jgi:predicted negative regulator of RcsB-dependent stress response
MRDHRTSPCAALAAAVLLQTGAARAEEPRDLYFGEALYHAHQEHWFEALERLDSEVAQHSRVDEPSLDSLAPLLKTAQFDVGDFELRYRMHHRAGRAIKAVLEADVPEPVRNEAAFRLARIHFQKAQPEDALAALARIRGEVPEEIRGDIEFLKANVQLALGHPKEAAVLLGPLRDSKTLGPFSAYNLGIALLEDEQPADALRQLDRAGQGEATDEPTRAIRDKSNLVLGTLLFEGSQFDAAQRSLERVRLEGPFSNQALLRAGWADASAQNFARAVVPWSLLVKRDATDAAVQEALLALPYAYTRLEVHGRAALLYGSAVETFGAQLARVDASLQSVREGEFLAALVREEIRQDKDWVIRLRSLPGAPETFYLATLMASHDFQTALQNYLDLEDMRKRLVRWQDSLDAFEDAVRLRRAHYEPLLPEIDQEFRRLDAQMRLRLEQREHLSARLHDLLTQPNPAHLATADEQALGAWIEGAEAPLGAASDPQSESLRRRVTRLKGLLTFTLETKYHERLTLAHAHLRELEGDVARLEAQYAAFVRARQAATHSYVGYDETLARLRTRASAAQQRLGALMTRQGEVLERVAIAELEARRERLEASLNQARFAFADSYDRAAKTQAH